MRTPRGGPTIGSLTAVLVLVTACSAPDPPADWARFQHLDAATTVLAEPDPSALAVATSAALFASAPAVVLSTDPAHGTVPAQQQRLPLLLLGGGAPADGAVRAELDRLGARTVLAADGAAAKRAGGWDGVHVVEDAADLPDRADPPAPPELTVLATDPDTAAAATVRAAGLPVTVVPDGDPRAADELRGVDRPERVLAVGPEFGDPERLDGHLATAAAGADLTRDRALSQKLLLLHQFRPDMLPDRARLDTTRDELSCMIHADGFGVPGEKLETWTTLRADAPREVVWGWKNFLDEDSPTFTAQQTMAIEPEPPVFVSYQ